MTVAVPTAPEVNVTLAVPAALKVTWLALSVAVPEVTARFAVAPGVPVRLSVVPGPPAQVEGVAAEMATGPAGPLPAESVTSSAARALSAASLVGPLATASPRTTQMAVWIAPASSGLLAAAAISAPDSWISQAAELAPGLAREGSSAEV